MFIHHKTRTSKTLPIIYVTYKTVYRNEEMDERTVGVVEESGEEVGLEGERI